ncbi:hypothetical protein K491DRAFT_358978 [Lophiostoma macrostomum CBS 122681]|uniref:Uncharacterized protein n=1 Tax=Lophiostoma macrostomum CBS 122681 TaxID=1314788 RepID=A0A6A6TBY7_9PLEO|nr:hypothetical protein K491DRAFT_358978 [Lophiostoma macrostomum CBS 122681]
MRWSGPHSRLRWIICRAAWVGYAGSYLSMWIELETATMCTAKKRTVCRDAILCLHGARQLGFTAVQIRMPMAGLLISPGSRGVADRSAWPESFGCSSMKQDPAELHWSLCRRRYELDMTDSDGSQASTRS